MDKTYLKTLELDKILAQAAEYATCAEARALLVEQPACENAEETRLPSARLTPSTACC